MQTDVRRETVTTVIFYHIPKTAGSSFLSAATANFPAEDLYIIDGAQVRHERSLAKFKNLSQARRDGIKFLLGHNSWGLDTFFSHPCTYIAFLRNPFNRIVSEYYHLIGKPAYLEDRVRFKMAGCSLAQYFEQGHIHWGHNVYVKMLLGIQQRDYAVTQHDYHRAAGILESRFACVGITERFDESLLLFNHVLGWSIKKYARRNTADNYKREEVNCGELKAMCRELEQYDILLYGKFRERFEAAIEQVSDLSVKLAELRENVAIHTAAEQRGFSKVCRRLAKRIVGARSAFL